MAACNDDKFQDERIVKLVGRKEVDEKTLELSFERPQDFENQNGQFAILNLRNPKVTELDLPYRWLPVVSNGVDEHVRFHIEQDESSFSKSCDLMIIGEEAVIYGPKG